MENRPPKNSRDITLIRDYRVDNFYQVYQSVRVAKAKLLFYDFDETLLHPLIPYVNIATETAKARFMAKIIQMPSLKL